MSKKSNQFSPEVRERAVRMVREHRGEYPSLWAAIESIDPRSAACPRPSTNGSNATRSIPACATASRHLREQMKALEREVKELRKANEILKLASAFFAQAELDRRLKS